MKNNLWTLCKIMMLLFAALIFTPLVIPKETPDPYLMGMPYTLWMGLLVGFILLGITVLGSFVHPGRNS